MEARVRSTLAAVWRLESAQLIAVLARIVRDVNLAEELAQEAFVAALEQWPADGIPANPGAWLTATARHRAIDLVRREQRFAEARAGRLRASEAELDHSNPAPHEALRDTCQPGVDRSTDVTDPRGFPGSG